MMVRTSRLSGLKVNSCKVERASSVCPWSIVRSCVVRGLPDDDGSALEAYGSRLSIISRLFENPRKRVRSI